MKKEQEGLTEKEQEELLNDNTMLMAVLIAQQQYLLKIGKLAESKKFVRNYLNNMGKENADMEIRKKEAN